MTRFLVQSRPLPMKVLATQGLQSLQSASSDGVEGRRPAASQQWVSAQRSPHRTSSFHHIRRSNSGYSRIFALYFCLTFATAYCCPLGFPMPGMSRPLRPVPGSPGLPGWSSLHRLLRVRCPSCGIGDLSAYPVPREPKEVPALLAQHFLRQP